MERLSCSDVDNSAATGGHRMILTISIVAALVGLGFASAAAFMPDTGVDGTAGAFLAVFGALSVTVALGVLMVLSGPFRARGLLRSAAIIVSILTALAAWFLMQNIVFAAMIVSLLALVASSATAEREATL